MTKAYPILQLHLGLQRGACAFSTWKKMAGLLRSVTRQVYAARQGLAVSRTFAYSSYSGKNINDSANPG